MHPLWIATLVVLSVFILSFIIILHIGLGVGSYSTRRVKPGMKYSLDGVLHTVPQLKFHYQPYFVKRKYHVQLLFMIKTMARLFEEHDIPYWMHAGTLLGAVRHRGFIPWDDDADFLVFEKDVERIEQLPWHNYRLEVKNGKLQSSEFRIKHPFVDLIPVFEHNGKMRFIWRSYEKEFPHEVFPVDWTFPLRKLPFESCRLPAPKQSKRVLFQNYGRTCLEEVKGRTTIETVLPWVGNHRMAVLFDMH